MLAGIGNLLTFSYANFVAATPAAPTSEQSRCVEATCNQPFSEHLRDRRCLDSYTPSDCVEPLPFALHLLKLNREYRAAMQQTHMAGVFPALATATHHALKSDRTTASSLSVELAARTDSPSIARHPELLIIERVRLAYRVLPPSVHSAVLDVSA